LAQYSMPSSVNHQIITSCAQYIFSAPCSFINDQTARPASARAKAAIRIITTDLHELIDVLKIIIILGKKCIRIIRVYELIEEIR